MDTSTVHKNTDAANDSDKKVYTIFCYKEVKTVPELSPQEDCKVKLENDNGTKESSWYKKSAPAVYNYITLFVTGILIWGTLWCAWGEGWGINGPWFKLTLVAVVAWGSGQILQAVTTLPALLAALLTGILARYLGFLDMNEFTQIDSFLRKLYPVIILGKASLGWDLQFMKRNWGRLAVLGTLPWLAEVVVLAYCVHFLLDFPLIWGFLLGSVYASLSCAIVMPAVMRIGATNNARNWAQLVCTGGGIDTALSVGVYGLIHSFMFFEANETYRYIKVAVTLIVGVALGVIIGTIAGVIPHRRDFYVTELRVTFVVVGGLLVNMLTAELGWSGAGGVAVLVCNATAASFWARAGWKLNRNPAATAYRVMWAALEPILFAYTGTFFEINSDLANVLIPGFGILAVCLLVRLSFACLTCWNFTLREKAFVCCAWIPKSIVEAVLCPVAIETVRSLGNRDVLENSYAENMMRLLIQAILITTPLGFLLTNHLGPFLLKEGAD